MSVNYNKLWKILSDRNMMKTDLIREAKISTNASFTVRESTRIERSMVIMNPVVFDKIEDEDSVSLSIKRLKVEYHLAIGIGLSSEEIRMIERDQI